MERDIQEFILELKRLGMSHATAEIKGRHLYAFVEQKEHNRLAREYNRGNPCEVCGHSKYERNIN